MANSAETIRERRKSETARGLCRVARRLTIERGLSGFTVDEVCEEVGVSRRTFFNYFASKENAVLGFPIDLDTTEVAERFLGTGPSGAGALIDDVIALVLGRWEVAGPAASYVDVLAHVVEREPHLVDRLVEFANQEERNDILLIERREGWPAGDPRAETAVRLVEAILRWSLEEFFRGDNDTDFHSIVQGRLGAVRQLFP